MRLGKQHALLLTCLGLAACGKGDDGNAAKVDPAGPAVLDAPSIEAHVIEDYRPVRDAARQLDPKQIPYLRRQLWARGSARVWAAFGLGKLCKSDRPAVTAALVSALSSWATEATPPSALELSTFARALGSCGSDEAEQLLRSWVAPRTQDQLPGLAEAAASGLVKLADRSGRLEERTLTALLDAAEREKNASFLQPLGRLPELSEALAARTLDVAGELVTQAPRTQRGSAILALGSVGPSATLPLVQLVLQADFGGPERALAAAALGRLGTGAQKSIDQTTKELLERGLPLRANDENWLALNTLLRLLERPDASRKALAGVAQAPLPEGATALDRAQRRRLVGLRCRAADLLAQANEQAPALGECDPDHGFAEQEARLNVLGRGPLKGRRGALFAERAASGDARVLQAALRGLPRHAEYAGTRELLVSALEKGDSGTQATALSVIAAYPERVDGGGKEPVPDPRVVTVVLGLLEEASPKPPLETVAAALAAAGALRVLTLKAAVERHCLGSELALHARAQAALALLGNPGRSCGPTKLEPLAPVQAGKSDESTLLVHIESDLGPLLLRLNSPDTGQARRRVAELVKQGYYDGTAVTASVPGFAVTWGDRDGDGYENAGLSALADELGPTPWEPNSVGFTSFSAGASSSLLLVTIGDAPAMTGEKTHLGSAEGPWHLLLPGDVFSSVRLE